jgi:hypothetical protein
VRRSPGTGEAPLVSRVSTMAVVQLREQQAEAQRL